MASFDSLPDELIEIIAITIIEDCDDELQRAYDKPTGWWTWDHNYSLWDSNRAILRLSVVNRRSYRVCVPLLWKTLFLLSRTNWKSLKAFARSVEPERRELVRRIVVTKVSFWPIKALRAQVALGVDPLSDDSTDVDELAVGSLEATATVMRLCPNLQSLTVTDALHSLRNLDDNFIDADPKLKAMCENIRTLSLSDLLSFDEKETAKLISLLPQLETLWLGHNATGEPERQLAQTIGHHSRLVELGMTGFECSEWLELSERRPWSAPIKRFALTELEEYVILNEIIPTLKQFGPTLCELVLDVDCTAEFEPVCLPHLERLKLAIVGIEATLNADHRFPLLAFEPCAAMKEICILPLIPTDLIISRLAAGNDATGKPKIWPQLRSFVYTTTSSSLTILNRLERCEKLEEALRTGRAVAPAHLDRDYDIAYHQMLNPQ